MGKQNKNPGKRWQELLGLSAVPYFGQDTIPYKDEDEEEFIFDPETMSLINPIDIESELYNKNAYEAGLYTEMYDTEGTFLGYAYTNDDFAYLDVFLDEKNYTTCHNKGNVKINTVKQEVTASSVSMFISDEFTEETHYELLFTYIVNNPHVSVYRNKILYGFDDEYQNGYKIGIDLPGTTGLHIETITDGEISDSNKCLDSGFSQGAYSIKIIRDGSEATIFIDDEEIGVIDDVKGNTLGLWKWGGGSSSIRDIFLKVEEEVAEPVKVNISTTVTDGKDPIESASVTATNTQDNTVIITGTTGKVGGCTLSNVPVGHYTITATATGYNDYSDTVEVTDQTTTLTITMSKKEEEIVEPVKVNISTTVTDGEGPIESASVTATNTQDNTIIITGTTDNAGNCTLSNVPVGSYTITATATDYNNYSNTVEVTDQTTTLTITMTPVGSINDDVQE